MWIFFRLNKIREPQVPRASKFPLRRPCKTGDPWSSRELSFGAEPTGDACGSTSVSSLKL